MAASAKYFMSSDNRPHGRQSGFGAPLADGKETRVIDGRGYLPEYPLRGDMALIAGTQGRRATQSA